MAGAGWSWLELELELSSSSSSGDGSNQQRGLASVEDRCESLTQSTTRGGKEQLVVSRGDSGQAQERRRGWESEGSDDLSFGRASASMSTG